MPIPPLVIHERLGRWARQLRPRLAGWPVRPVETRSAEELEQALAGAPCALGLLDLARRPADALEDLHRARRAGPEALLLVLEPAGRPGLAPLAYELGATLVLAGPVVPPAVVDLFGRWLPLARRRAEAAGWHPGDPPEPAGIDALVGRLLDGWPARRP